MSDAALSATRMVLLESLFDGALALPEPSREEFIAISASHDPWLEAELRGLLAAHARTDSEFVLPVRVEHELAERYVGSRLGAYEIGRQIGAGGMGTVHEAVRADDQYRARVAVKFLRRSADSAVAIRRFRAERQILASLQHPNIASLVDGGVTPDGLPYFVMEYIDGVPITRWCEGRRLDVSSRLALFEQVCAAVRAAHQKLVVHRDLKPGNILVTADGTVKLLDFGIAKLIRDGESDGDATATQAGQRAFTPEYAAPEQMVGSAVDTTTDVYALGVVLFELLTGRRPFDLQGKTAGEMERIVTGQPAPRPSSVLSATRWQELSERSAARARRSIEGDLDAIVLMALRKEPDRRYASVDALARDVERHREQLPVQARPDSLTYRVRKFVTRRRWETMAGAAAVLSLVGGTVAALREARRAEAQAVLAKQEGARATEVSRFLTTMLNAANPESFGRDITMRAVLDSAVMRADSANLTPALEAEVRAIIGGAYLALGEIDVAERQYRLDIAAQRRLAPGGSYGLATAHAGLALVEETRGNFAAADSLLTIAERLYARFPHTDRRQEAAAHENRGRVLYQQGKIVDALTQFRKSLDLSARYFATDDAANAPAYVNFAVGAAEAGQLAVADTFSQRSIDAAKHAHGVNHPLVANAWSVRAGVLESLGRMEESSQAYRETLAVKRRILGPQHISYATTATNYADHLLQMKQWRESATVAREVLALRGTSLDDTTYPVQLCLALLGRALAQLDSAQAGERYVREARALRQRDLPSGHWLLASMDGALGEVVTMAKRYAEAEALLLRAEQRLTEARGAESIPAQLARQRLVELYRRWGKPAKVAEWQATITKSAT
jgi:serine/threonine protein kinase/tetratricopeptide (TPR) repeat protein